MKKLVQLFFTIFKKRKKTLANHVPYQQTENWKAYVSKLKNRLSQRIDKDLENADLRRAIDRYEGFLKRFPMEQDIRNQLGELYIKNNDKIRAGKNLYFKENPSAEELECIKKFEHSFGNDPTIILRKLVDKEGFKVSVFHEYGQRIIRQKLIEIRTKTGTMPKVLLGIENHLNKKSPLN